MLRMVLLVISALAVLSLSVLACGDSPAATERPDTPSPTPDADAGITPPPTQGRSPVSATATVPNPGSTSVPSTLPPTSNPGPAPTETPTLPPPATPTEPPTPTPEPVSTAAWEGAPALLPDGLSRVEVWDWEAALSSGTVDLANLPEDFYWPFGELAQDPLNSGFSLEDIRSFALARVETEGGPEMELNVVEGDFDLTKVREFLDDTLTQFLWYDGPEDFRRSYKGYDLYEGEHSRWVLALLPDKNAIVMGDSADAVVVLLDAVASGTGLLLHGGEYRIAKYRDYHSVASEEFIRMTLNRLGGGFFAVVRHGSSSSSFDGCCWASGYSVSRGSGDDMMVTIVYPFREEGLAEGQVEQVRAHLEANLPDNAVLVDMVADGTFVVGTATVAADLWREEFNYYWVP